MSNLFYSDKHNTPCPIKRYYYTYVDYLFAIISESVRQEIADTYGVTFNYQLLKNIVFSSLAGISVNLKLEDDSWMTSRLIGILPLFTVSHLTSAVYYSIHPRFCLHFLSTTLPSPFQSMKHGNNVISEWQAL